MTSRTRMYFQLAQFNSEYENLMNVFKFEGWNQDNISSITGIRTADLSWRQQAKHQNEDLVIVFHSLTEGKVRGCQRSWRQENRQLQVQDYHSYSRMLTSLDHMLSQQHFLFTDYIKNFLTFWRAHLQKRNQRLFNLQRRMVSTL